MQQLNKIEYSFIVPIYNDGYLADAFCKSFQETFQKYLEQQIISEFVELIFVNDGSHDNSMDLVTKITEQYKFVKVIDLSRNFGQHIALSAGYKYASGSFVGMLNVDMQEHPNQIPILLDYIKSNNTDIVYGLRKKRKGPFFDKVTSYLFSTLLNKLTGSETPLNVSTLRVMNRRFMDAYLSLTEKSRYLPGLENWLGFNKGFIEIEHSERKTGKSSYNFKKRLIMAVDSIISFSDLPLKIISILGILVALIGFVLTAILIISKLFFIEFQHGFTLTITVMVLIGGVQIMVIGFASLYIGRILKEVQNRPLYIIKEKVNF